MARNRDAISYWIGLGWAVMFWTFGASVVSMGLSMSLAGRIKGGALMNGLDVRSNELRCGNVEGTRSAVTHQRLVAGQGARPVDQALHQVWWLGRVFYISWFSIVGFMALLALVTWAGSPGD